MVTFEPTTGLPSSNKIPSSDAMDTVLLTDTELPTTDRPTPVPLVSNTAVKFDESVVPTN